MELTNQTVNTAEAVYSIGIPDGDFSVSLTVQISGGGGNPPTGYTGDTIFDAADDFARTVASDIVTAAGTPSGLILTRQFMYEGNTAPENVTP